MTVVSDLFDLGYHYIPGFIEDLNDAESAVWNLISSICTPLHVYRNLSFWKALPTDTERPRTRSGGVGLNSLHMDCVNLENPPDLIFFYCLRNDPAGGGTTLVCPLRTLSVPDALLSDLRQPIYRDGAAYDLDGVGKDINPFPIFADDADWQWRYTGRILETIGDQDTAIDLGAIVEFDRLAANHAIGFDLKPGDVLIVNQRLALHGRLPMGPGQESLSLDERRLVVQAYGRL